MFVIVPSTSFCIYVGPNGYILYIYSFHCHNPHPGAPGFNFHYHVCVSNYLTSQVLATPGCPGCYGADLLPNKATAGD